MLERMELIAPAHVDNPFHFKFRQPEFLPSPLLTMENIVAGYGDKIVLEQIKLNLVPGSRIGLLGRNGAGKSTLIKLLAGELLPMQGQVSLAKGIQLGYFAQHQLEYLRADESALWHLKQLAEPKNTEQELRNYLGGFDFHGDKVSEPVKTFSGGEKARLVLALIVWQKPNLLLLDEPTNHLDLDMRQALTEALIDFEGALVVVSHDRHLLRSTTDEFYLVHDHKVEPFNGDLDDYHKWLTEEQKDAEARAQLQPLKKQLQKEEKIIARLNDQLKIIEEQLADPDLYGSDKKTELTQLLLNQSNLKIELDKAESSWFDLQQQLEEFEAE